MKYSITISSLLILYIVSPGSLDKPCAARQVSGRSVLCVCNSTYCDEVERQRPDKNGFIAYTTSKAGSRFRKNVGYFQPTNNQLKCCKTTLTIDPTEKHQKVEGFGGAVTDAAAINWKSMPEELQQHLINSYFSVKGLEYNMLRVPIGGCDFSTHPYAYNELPENDYKLSNYSLTTEDNKYKIPMIEAINKVATSPVHIVATTWSPPVWMKTNHKFSGFGQLKQEFYDAYALYHYKFIEKYEEAGIKIWAITTTNEPINGYFGIAPFNSLGWSIYKMGEWIVNNLGPTIRNSKYRDVKILTGDDQRFTIPFWFNVMLRKHPKALEYIDGVGVHYYADKFVPPAVLYAVSKTHPDKIVLATEACEGSFPWQKEKVELGSWTRAITYVADILEDLNYNVVGWIDWNLCLDTRGGPNWAANFVDSAIIVNNTEFYKQPMFYAVGHFSKFIKRGAARISVSEEKSFLTGSLKHTAFQNPDGHIVLVVLNEAEKSNVLVKCGKGQATVELEADSFTTMEFFCDV
ncbi:unnamed protein product, partial [Iphiclides podalirius]